MEAVSSYGLPSCIRTDQGRENVLIAQHMLENRRLDHGSVLTGSSVHNQRVERLWKDMHDCVTKLFYKLFYYLEELGTLNPNDDVHIFALHLYIFRKWYDSNALKYKASYLLRHLVLGLLVLRHLLA